MYIIKKTPKMLRIISLLYILRPMATAIDPWERNFHKTEDLKNEDSIIDSNNNNLQSASPMTECKGGSIDDFFYKRLLGLIISRGRFKESEDGMVEGSLNFEIPVSTFESLKEILSKTEPFTPEDYRTVDGLMSDYLQKLSFTRQLAETWAVILLSWWTHYYINIMIWLGICVFLYVICNSNWPRIPLGYVIIWIFFFISLAWEIMLAIQEADLKDHNDFIEQSRVQKNCESYWNYVFSDCNNSQVVRRVSHYWHYLDPVKILSNIFTKIFTSNIQLIYSSVDILLLSVSEKAPYGTQALVHGLLSIFAIVLLIFISLAFIFNVLLNRPFSLSFLFLNFNLKQKVKSTSSDDSNNTEINGSRPANEDTLSGDNLKILMTTLNKTFKSTTNNETDDLTNRNIRQPQIGFKTKKYSRHTTSNTAGNSKTAPNRESSGNVKNSKSVKPLSNKKQGGGDHLD